MDPDLQIRGGAGGGREKRGSDRKKNVFQFALKIRGDLL